MFGTPKAWRFWLEVWFLGLGLGVLVKEGVCGVLLSVPVRLMKPYKARISLSRGTGTLGTPSTPIATCAYDRTCQAHIKGFKVFWRARGPPITRTFCLVLLNWLEG
jgi:hypothetical protein